MALDAIDLIVAKLTVLIEGVADHKMDDYNKRGLGREIIADIQSLCSPMDTDST